MIPLRLFDSSAEFIEYLEDTLIPDLLESGRRSTAADFKEAIYWITKKQTRSTAKQTKTSNTPTKKRKLSAWQKYIKNKKNHIKFKSGPKKGRLDLSKMSRAFKRSKR